MKLRDVYPKAGPAINQPERCETVNLEAMMQVLFGEIRGRLTAPQSCWEGA